MPVSWVSQLSKLRPAGLAVMGLRTPQFRSFRGADFWHVDCSLCKTSDRIIKGCFLADPLSLASKTLHSPRASPPMEGAAPRRLPPPSPSARSRERLRASEMPEVKACSFTTIQWRAVRQDRSVSGLSKTSSTVLSLFPGYGIPARSYFQRLKLIALRHSDCGLVFWRGAVVAGWNRTQL
jgi:hypothetical protein